MAVSKATDSFLRNGDENIQRTLKGNENILYNDEESMKL
jgi:hypothetical protein